MQDLYSCPLSSQSQFSELTTEEQCPGRIYQPVLCSEEEKAEAKAM